VPENSLVANHYTHGSLLEAIQRGVQALGKTTANVGVEDLGPVDEFHIGGRAATADFLDQLDITTDHHVLDVGCGLGGASRFAAQRYGCRVSGVDLTPEYVDTGAVLCDWVGLGERISLAAGDATALSHAGDTFDRAYLMHVGMNIADKQGLVRELLRVLRPGAKLGIYDVMRVGAGELAFPVPWATAPEGSALASPGEYKAALQSAGFRVIAERNRRDFALEFFKQLQAKAASAGGPPPLGLHILMGEAAAVKVKNMVENIARGLIAPVELIAGKAS
jgi:ubiquinone/menaquinone biosynthesis C-methylase UbiE